MQRLPLLRFLILLFAALLIPVCAPSRSRGNPVACLKSPAGGTVAHAENPPIGTGDPFLVRRAGMFGRDFPDPAVKRFGNMKTYLWYGFFASDPCVWPNNFTTHDDFEELLREAESHGMVLQLGFEPWSFMAGKSRALHLGTLKEALDPPDRDELVARINQALAQGQDPLSQLAPRQRPFEAMEDPPDKNIWDPMSMDLNIFLVDVVKWGRYLGSKNRTVILRPLSEMNEVTAGSWYLGKYPGRPAVNSPDKYVDVWLALVSILRRSGLTHAYYVFAPQAVSTTPEMFGKVEKAMNGILARDPTAISAFGVDVYSNKLHPHDPPFSFATLVKQWLKLFGKKGLPLVVPEMGVDKRQFPRIADRAKWISEAFQEARQLDFVNVNYFHDGDFIARTSPSTLRALKQGLAGFQSP